MEEEEVEEDCKKKEDGRGLRGKTLRRISRTEEED